MKDLRLISLGLGFGFQDLDFRVHGSGLTSRDSDSRDSRSTARRTF